MTVIGIQLKNSGMVSHIFLKVEVRVQHIRERVVVTRIKPVNERNIVFAVVTF